MKVKWLSLLMAMLMTLNSIMLVSVIADDAVNYEEDVKVYSGEITEASDLQSTNVLYVVLKKEYSDPNVSITKDYFPELNIIGIKDLMKINNPSERKYLNEDNYRHILKIYLGDSSLEYLNTAKNLLEARNDVKYVSAAENLDIMDFDTNANNILSEINNVAAYNNINNNTYYFNDMNINEA